MLAKCGICGNERLAELEMYRRLDGKFNTECKDWSACFQRAQEQRREMEERVANADKKRG